ncbi:hypothetical protein FSOLCH5_000306 [Fusarium solani]|uniref:Uncharacterized protein n=1 Tax=Fusarium solani TaxID=169388 RepID=A0A9P9K5V3_FUSSL|nr:uncharacterized protein B0J15DRAFT_467397 [Fusarium solani]KAH7250527.1 hypothetical protein B0J15DRAFT_467397 [Fusarium solani]KAJ4222155.1 hypothetical protein NW759_006579 [Fusarium solani]
MRLVAWGLWLASVQVAQAATSGRFGHRSFRKRQAVEEPAAPKFEGLRLSYVTETTTEKVTETQVIVQTAQNDAVAAAETVTVTINPPAVTVTINAPAETVTINAPPITITEVAAAPPPITVTETITSAVAQPFTVVEVSPITIVEVSPITVVDVVTQPVPQPPVTETITVAGEAPPPVTLIETVQAPADSVEDNKTAGPGVTTIPIAESALPTTTFSEDPLAQSRVEESSSAEESATSAKESATSAEESTAPAQESTASAKESTASSKASTTTAKESTTEVASVPNDTTEAVPTTEAAPVATSAPAIPVMESNIVLGPSPSNDAAAPAPAQPTGGSNSLNLGDLAPDATADAGTALPAVTAEPEAEEPRTRAPINISTLSLSSAINLGNLGGGGAGLLKARATNAP